MLTIRTASIALAATATVACADVIQVPYASLTGEVTEGFEAFDAGGGFEGANYDGVISNMLGLHIGERFVGQMIGDGVDQDGVGVHDVVTGAPTPGLALAVGEPGQNLVIGDTSFVGGTGHAVSGLSSVGYPDFNAIGEGAVAVLFDADQFEFGFTVFGDTGAGDVFLDFFGRDGSLLGSITLDEVADAAYGFRTDDGAAAIAGVLITNNENEGLAFDNMNYHLVPAPGAAALLLLGAGAARRRR